MRRSQLLFGSRNLNPCLLWVGCAITRAAGVLLSPDRHCGSARSGLQWKGMQGAVGLLLRALVLSPVFDFADEPRVM